MTADWHALLGHGVRARDLSDLCAALGPRLSSAWLTPEALSVGNPTLAPRDWLKPGEFGVLLHLPDAGPHVHQGVVLPCRWKPADERTLPRDLRKLAEWARAAVALSYFRGAPSDEQRRRLQGLHLCLGDGCGDLSNMVTSPDSASALLMATLAIAVDGLAVAPDVSASATFSDTLGAGAVNHMLLKRIAAKRAGIRTVLTAPGQGEVDPCDGAADADRIRPRDPREQLGYMLLRMNQAPIRGSLEDRAQWYRSASEWSGEEARRSADHFFAEHLVRDVVKHRGLALMASGGTLILAATGRAEASLVAIAAHRPAQVIIVTLNDESQRFADRLAQLLAPAGLHTVRWRMVRLDELTAHTPPFEWPRPLSADLTGGNTEAKIRLSDWSRDHGIVRTAIDTPRMDPLKTSLVELDPIVR